MPKGSTYEEMAKAAARNIEAARAAGEQLNFLTDPGEVAVPEAEGSGRAPRGKGKAQAQLREYLAARGMRLPEAQLAEIAGLTSRDDVFLWAMQRADQVMAWAEAGATPAAGAPGKATLGQRLQTFQVVFTAAVRAAEALLPYGLGKITPEETAPPAVQVMVMPGARAVVAGQGPDQARDVTPKPGRLAPPPLPHEMQQNQQVMQAQDPASDVSDWTE